MKQEPVRALPITILFLVMTVAAWTAGAQEYKGEVFGSFGHGSVGEDDGSLGGGFVLGGGIGYRFSRRWGVEFDISRHGYQRDFSGDGIVHQWDGNALILAGSLLCHFRPEDRTQPYLRFGVSYANQELNEVYRVTPSASFDPGSEAREETIHRTTKHMGLDLGFGVRIFVSERVSIRPELRYSILNERGGGKFPEVLHVPWVSVGVSYHW